ncbi:MAG: NAD(P)H-binding protein [Candidatus Melainabacteria bacterium]|nr:NAD(P)H-binding protein [Candidatus Melainabacteria bacterium]
MPGSAPAPERQDRGDLAVVTGAFGYSGRYITRELLARGKKVKTLVSHKHLLPPEAGEIVIDLLDFDDARSLAEKLDGAQVFYNTYWVRFNRGPTSFEKAVRNTGILLEALRMAGVTRLVHLSVTNPESGSMLPYFAGKATIERMIKESGLSYAIVRPALIFGPEDILVNNIAWLLRRFPLFAIPGRGDYKVQPVFAADMARQCVDLADIPQNLIVDCLGEDVFTFEEILRLIAKSVGSHAGFIHVPPFLSIALCRLLNCFLDDVLLTKDELSGLMNNLLVSTGTPCGTTRFSNWITENAANIGKEYHSELARHFPG